MENKKIILVLGIPGSGKTTILDGVEGYKDYKYVNVGTVMKKATEEIYKENIDRDKIRYLKEKEIDQIRDRTFEIIIGMEGKILVDTHSSIEREGKFITGLPYESKFMKLVRSVIYIDASPEEILYRRSLDKTRKREADDEYMLKVQREFNISTLSFYMSYLNIPVYMVNNQHNKVAESISRMKQVLDLIDLEQ